jgi:hypothetical protein
MAMKEGVATVVFRTLPPRLRERIKSTIGATGHSRSWLDGYRAHRLGRTWKQPSRVMADLLEVAYNLGWKSFGGKRIMDYGCGILPADALGYAMLGAREVVAVDYTPLLQPAAFRRYASSRYWLGMSLGCSGRLSDALKSNAADWYSGIGIRYVAPYDLVKDLSIAEPFDLIASRSTLEHLPADAVAELLQHMSLVSRAQYHNIHLADHRDIDGDPYGFLRLGNDWNPTQHDTRGNRLRASDWSRLFAATGLKGKEMTLASDFKLFPSKRDPVFANHSYSDLLATSYIVYGHQS